MVRTVSVQLATATTARQEVKTKCPTRLAARKTTPAANSGARGLRDGHFAWKPITDQVRINATEVRMLGLVGMLSAPGYITTDLEQSESVGFSSKLSARMMPKVPSSTVNRWLIHPDDKLDFVSIH